MQNSKGGKTRLLLLPLLPKLINSCILVNYKNSTSPKPLLGGRSWENQLPNVKCVSPNFSHLLPLLLPSIITYFFKNQLLTIWEKVGEAKTAVSDFNILKMLSKR